MCDRFLVTYKALLLSTSCYCSASCKKTSHEIIQLAKAGHVGVAACSSSVGFFALQASSPCGLLFSCQTRAKFLRCIFLLYCNIIRPLAAHTPLIRICFLYS